MKRVRRDSTEKDVAAPVCAVAVTVQRNSIHCEGSQQLLNNFSTNSCFHQLTSEHTP